MWKKSFQFGKSQWGCKDRRRGSRVKKYNDTSFSVIDGRKKEKERSSVVSCSLFSEWKKRMHVELLFNCITSALLLRQQVFSSWYRRHLTQSLCSQAEPNFFPFLLPYVLKIEARHSYYLLGVGLHEMANKTDNILYWICNCKASQRWHFPSLSVSRTWWRSHYPADCGPMCSQLWRELMWAFSYIWFPLEETVTRGDWAERLSKSNCWNDRKAIHFQLRWPIHRAGASKTFTIRCKTLFASSTSSLHIENKDISVISLHIYSSLDSTLQASDIKTSNQKQTFCFVPENPRLLM